MKQKNAFKSLIGTATIFVLCISMMFAMAGCGSSDSSAGSNSDSTTVAGDSTVKDSKKAAAKEVKLAEFRVKSKDGKEVSLGMKKDDVVKLLGEGKEGSFQNMYEYGQLSVSYTNDTVVTIIYSRMSSDEQPEYTFRGVKLGDKKADVLKAIGEPTKPFSDITADKKKTDYYYKVDGENCTFVTDERSMNEDISKAVYTNYMFEYNDDDTLKSISALNVRW